MKEFLRHWILHGVKCFLDFGGWDDQMGSKSGGGEVENGRL